MKACVSICRPGPPGLEILRVSGAVGEIAVHEHASWCILAVERGERVVTSKAGPVRLGPGDALVIPGHTAHACSSPEPGCAFWALNFVVDAPSPRDCSPARLDAASVPGGSMARLLLAVARGDDRLALPSLQGVLDRALACASPRQGGVPAWGTGRSVVTMVRELLESPGEPDASLDHLARRAGVGRALLCRLFRRETGITINECRTLARLRRVRGLLTHGASLAGAAADAGFHDQSHMTIRFKKYMGMTPGLYARAAR